MNVSEIIKTTIENNFNIEIVELKTYTGSVNGVFNLPNRKTDFWFQINIDQIDSCDKEEIYSVFPSKKCALDLPTCNLFELEKIVKNGKLDEYLNLFDKIKEAKNNVLDFYKEV